MELKNMTNANKKHFFSWRRKKKQASSKETEKEILDMNEDLFHMAEKCTEKIKSLKSQLSELNDLMTAIGLKFGYAKCELGELKTEMYGNEKIRILLNDKARNLDAKIISLETELDVGQSNIQIAKIKGKIILKNEFSSLENIIKEMNNHLSKSKRTKYLGDV